MKKVRAKKVRFTKSELLRAGFIILSIAAPAVLVLTVGNQIAESVGASISDQVKKRLLGGDNLSEALKGLGEASSILNAILVVYLGWGAVLAAVGNCMRAFAHSDDTRKGVDFGGKCLAVSSGSIVATGSLLRFIPDYSGYLPKWLWCVLVGSIIALVFFGAWAGRVIKRADDSVSKWPSKPVSAS